MSRVIHLALGNWQSHVLFTLAELNVFDIVGKKHASAPDIARLIDSDPDSTEALLNAGVGIGLLSKNHEEYRVAKGLDRILCSDSPDSLAHWIRVMGRWSHPWAQLTEVVRTGTPAEDRMLWLTQDTNYVADFVIGMHEYAIRVADELAEKIELDEPGLLVDVGGGCGTYTIALCRQYPFLQAHIIELETVLPLARRFVAEAGMSDRVEVSLGNYLTDSFPSDASAVLLSNIIHQESRDAGMSIVRRSYEALRPGGRIILNGYFLNEDRTKPPFTTLHNLSAFILWNGGRSYTVDEAKQLLARCGFAEPDVISISGGASTVITARKENP